MAAATGPRLAGRLTSELILRSPQYMNCVRMYEIDLRGNKVAVIENLGATENQFDSIDLSDNAVMRLEGFPKLHRLKQLLLNNNRVARTAKHLEDAIPNLEILVLTNNRINNLQDLDPLATLTKLTMLSLIGNPVALKPNYRLYTIAKLKKLKVLDFRKVKQKEREEAARLFGSDEAVAAHQANTFDPSQDLEAAQQRTAAAAAAAEAAPAAAAAAAAATRAGPTAEQKVAIAAAIANAATLEDIQRLEALLVSGHVPSELQIGSSGAGAAAPDSNGHAAAAAASSAPTAMEVG